MIPELEAESTLTDRYQTTVPEPVRRALRLGKRDKIHYAIRADGAVVLSRAPREDDADPALEGLLRLLAHDMSTRPDRLRPLDPALMEQACQLLEGVEVDLNAPLPADDEL